MRTNIRTGATSQRTRGSRRIAPCAKRGSAVAMEASAAPETCPECGDWLNDDFWGETCDVGRCPECGRPTFWYEPIGFLHRDTLVEHCFPVNEAANE